MINTRESIIQEGLRRLEQPRIDRQWVESWLDHRKRSTTQITLSEYRQRLITHAHLLHDYQTALEQQNQSSLVLLRGQIQRSNEMIYHPDLVKEMQTKIHKRKSKRARLRRHKETIAHPSAITPTKVTIQRATPKRKSWTEKVQDVQTLLQTIHHHHDQVQSDSAKEQLKELEKQCHAKMQEYQVARDQDPETDLCRYLFDNQGHSFYESSDPSAQPYLRAHTTQSNLLQTRETWDRYLSPANAGSSLPLQWHTPVPPSDTNWTKFLFPRTS